MLTIHYWFLLQIYSISFCLCLNFLEETGVFWGENVISEQYIYNYIKVIQYSICNT